ncbi:GNAT family N-acetyltransferase [Defluviimonas sp. WL0050]|uniref:GNAT family N-acetyltransferase n=1 Tax=Albidovulum litorale TaxID=2984134 RepID=A0ABT2ZTJ7_9RHOB|nr:GNAT family N-acetyltransferase [Defluviimonas sp. WL0050]MCV2874285.1 GNAT family N-acetyltransferase [Defluviimonas sp. WL0050]
MIHAWEQPSTGPAAAFAASLAAMIPVIETARLRLRAPHIGDFDDWAAIECSERGRYIGGPMSREDAWRDFTQATATWLLRGHGLWTVEDKADRVLLGFVLLGFEPGDREPELGFLFSEAAEGKGLAHEAANAARSHAFGALGWDTLVSYIVDGNDRSVRLADRLGATRDRASEVAFDDPVLVYRHYREGRT